MDNLAKAAFLAAQEGISYGQWMAKHKGQAMPKVKKQANICPNCGGVVTVLSKFGKHRKYCSDQCMAEYNHMKYTERRRN